MGDESSKMPKKRPKIIQKYEEIVKWCDKNEETLERMVVWKILTAYAGM